jgi:hypothetical protein
MSRKKQAAPGTAKARVEETDSYEQTEASVLVLVAAAAKAVRARDIDGLIACLDKGVAVRHPAHAQQERSQLRALITFIRSARSRAHVATAPMGTSTTRRRTDVLEHRAESLHSTIH